MILVDFGLIRYAIGKIKLIKISFAIFVPNLVLSRTGKFTKYTEITALQGTIFFCSTYNFVINILFHCKALYRFYATIQWKFRKRNRLWIIKKKNLICLICNKNHYLEMFPIIITHHVFELKQWLFVWICKVSWHPTSSIYFSNKIKFLGTFKFG